MPTDDLHDLAPETIELFKRIAGHAHPDSSGIDEVLLGAFACGISTPDQEQTTLAALIRSRELRAQLEKMNAQLELMRASPFTNVTDKAFPPILVHCLRAAMQASMRFYCRSHLICLDRGWNEISTARDLEAKTMRALIGSIGSSIQSMLLLTNKDPGFLGREKPQENVNSIDGTEVKLDAFIRDDGALVVHGNIDELRFMTAGLSNSGFHVELMDPNGGTIPLSDVIVSPSWSVIADGFAEIAGLEVGPLPPSLFRVGLRNNPVCRDGGHHLVASVEGSKDTIAFRIVKEPKIEREQLTVLLQAPPNAVPLLESHQLELFVPVGNINQCIGSWQPGTWPDNQFSLKCVISGVVDGQIECGSVLHIRLVQATD